MSSEPARVPATCPSCLEPIRAHDLVTADGCHLTCRGGPPRLVTTLATGAADRGT